MNEAPPGIAGEALTLLDLFHGQVERSRARVAFRHKQAGVWRARTWEQWELRAREVAAGLCALGVRPGDTVAVLGGTRMCWVEADTAILLAGAVTVPIYPTLRADAVDHILRDSGAKVLFADDPTQVEKLYQRGVPEGLSRVVVFDRVHRLQAPDARGRLNVELSAVVPVEDRGRVLEWPALIELGRERLAERPEELGERRAGVRGDSLASLVYTSGTSGVPKGVMLTHASFVFETEVVARAMPVGTTDEQLLFLPLAHIFARLTIFLQMRAGFATALSSDALSAVDDCEAIRPTFLVSVPRLYEKIHETAQHAIESSGEMRRRVWDWAFRVGAEVAVLRAAGRQPRGRLAIEYRYAHKLVFKPLHERLGGRIRFLVSGAAPLGRETAEFFDAAGLLLLEGYGLTETAGAATVNLPHQHRMGTVGPPLRGVEIRVAEDGEILIRGRNVMRGYHGLPEKTRRALDAEGWLHTGDIGRLDEDGFLVITDRKKDVLITSGGKKIAPRKLEQRLEANPLVSHAVVVADRRPHAVALLALTPEAVKAWARDRGISGDFRSLLAHPEVEKLVQGLVDELNEGLASYETLKRFALLEHGLSEERGELTPTLKVRRREVIRAHRTLIDGLYE